LVASAAVVVALALVMPVVLRLTGGITTNPWESGTADTSDTSNEPGQRLPPWQSGSLTLASLTYRSQSTASASGSPSFDLLTDRTEGTIRPSETESGTVPDTLPDGDVYGEGENYSVSILDNMKITDYLEGGLIKLRPDSGDHARCPDVYYDIASNEYVCMSCRIGDLLTGSDMYAEAALDCLMEECLLSYTPLMASGMNDSYEDTYRFALSRSGLKEKPAQRKKICCPRNCTCIPVCPAPLWEWRVSSLRRPDWMISSVSLDAWRDSCRRRRVAVCPCSACSTTKR
jgi:hypothetical protein